MIPIPDKTFKSFLKLADILYVISKISIKRVVEDLKLFGYKVSIAGIPDLTTDE